VAPDTGPRADDLIRRYQLVAHPEGGFYQQSYRAAGSIPATCLPGYPGDRALCTAIRFLLPAGSVSRLHRLRSDEIWHFYLGGPLMLVELSANGAVTESRLGNRLERDEEPQRVVLAGTWFGAYPAPGTDYSLMGCTVAPGFEFTDFELGDRTALLGQFPAARETILRMT